MEFRDYVLSRSSCREFDVSRSVKREDVEFILEMANRAPSAGNLQAYEIIVVTKEETKRRLSFGRSKICDAPVVLVFCSNEERNSRKYGSRGINLYSIQDATIAATYAQLAAHSIGLGSVWIGAFDESIVLEAVRACEPLRPVAMLPIGYPSRKPRGITNRRPIPDLVHWESL